MNSPLRVNALRICTNRRPKRASANGELEGAQPEEMRSDEDRTRLESDLAAARERIAQAESVQTQASSRAGDLREKFAGALRRARRRAGRAWASSIRTASARATPASKCSRRLGHLRSRRIAHHRGWKRFARKSCRPMRNSRRRAGNAKRSRTK